MIFDSFEEFEEEFSDFDSSFLEKQDILVNGELSYEYVRLPDNEDIPAILIMFSDSDGSSEPLCFTSEGLTELISNLTDLQKNLEEME